MARLMSSVYFKNGVCAVITESQTTDGIWTHDGDCTRVSATDNPETLGSVIRHHLARSCFGVLRSKEHPNTSVLSTLGFTTWKQCERQADVVAICYRPGSSIELEPFTRRRSGGYDPCPSNVVVLNESATDRELGDACRAILVSLSAQGKK